MDLAHLWYSCPTCGLDFNVGSYLGEDNNTYLALSTAAPCKSWFVGKVVVGRFASSR